MKRANLKACFLWFATMITLRFDYIRTMRVNDFTTIWTWFVSVHAGIYGMGIYAIMLPSSGFSVAHYKRIWGSTVDGSIILNEICSDFFSMSFLSHCPTQLSDQRLGSVTIKNYPRLSLTCHTPTDHPRLLFLAAASSPSGLATSRCTLPIYLC